MPPGKPLRSILLLLVSIAASFASAAGARTADVVLITIDTLRADAVDFGGNTRGTTPHLDAFAREGRVFTAAHAHTPLTLPSHATILTGLYPFGHGIRDNAGFRLPDRIPTLATVLKARGYATAAFVAAFPLDPRYGLTRGFDVYEPVYQERGDVSEFHLPESRADAVVSAALSWFRQPGEKPKFLWVHLYDPHAPYDPPEPFAGRFADAPYLGEVAFADASLSPLLDEIRAEPIAPLLIVTGDHGEALGDHGEITHGLFAYEATLRVPLLFWKPDRVGKGVDPYPVRHVDVAPTIYDALGIPVPGGLPGRSLLRPSPSDPPVYFEALSASLNRGWAPLSGILERGIKFIDLPVPELYDLTRDPGEKENLAVSRRDLVRKARADLDRFGAGTAPERPTGAEETARLRSLGYFAGAARPGKPRPEDDPKNLIAVDRQLHAIVRLFGERRVDDAVAVAREVVAERPSMLIGYEQLSFLLESKGDAPTALALWERAKKNGVTGESVERRRALLLGELGRAGDAARALAPFSGSHDVETLVVYGTALADSGEPDRGIAVLRHAETLDPESAAVHSAIGIAELKAGRPAPAREALERALSVNRRNARAWNALGVAFDRLGSSREALDAWSRAAENDPEQYDALYNIGIVAARLGDAARARESLARFVKTAPRDRYDADIRDAQRILETLAP